MWHIVGMKTTPAQYKAYPSDVSDAEWSFVAPYLILNRVDGENRKHDLRAVFNALRWLVRSGASWRMMPHEFPPWPAVYQQMRRWLEAGCFEAMVHDLRVLLREYLGREGQPSAMILDSRTIQSTPESGARAGYDGAKRGFVLLPRRWVVERSFAWAARFRRLARDYERLPETLAGLHFIAFAMLMNAKLLQHFMSTS